MRYISKGHGKSRRVIPISDSQNKVSTRQTSVDIPMKHKGSLKKFGFSLKEAMSKQYQSLVPAISEYGKGKVVEKLNALRVMFKNKDPDYSEELSKDIAFVRAYKEYKKK